MPKATHLPPSDTVNEFNEVFVASLGLTPQVVTESLYHYYNLDKPRIFTRIVLLTTEKGRQLVVQKLFKEGRLTDLEKTLGLARGTIPLKEEDIVVFADAQGVQYQDIRTSSASLDEVQQVFQIISRLTQTEETRLTVTVAGGRKSMSVTMAIALQLFGRAQDEMVHVLVQSPYDSQPDWFFPQDREDPLQKIDVVQIPFLRIRPYLPSALLRSADKEPDVQKILELTQIKLDQARPAQLVTVHHKRMNIDGQVFSFPPREMSLWRYLARRKLDHCTQPDRSVCEPCRECWVDINTLLDAYLKELLQEYMGLVGRHNRHVEERSALNPGSMDLEGVKGNILQTKSCYNRLLKKKALLSTWIAQLAITAEGAYIKRYGIPLDRSSIQIVK